MTATGTRSRGRRARRVIEIDTITARREDGDTHEGEEDGRAQKADRRGSTYSWRANVSDCHHFLDRIGIAHVNVMYLGGHCGMTFETRSILGRR